MTLPGNRPIAVFWAPVGRVTREAMVMSFEDGFRITMLAIGLGIFMVLLLKRAKAAPGAPSGAH